MSLDAVIKRAMQADPTAPALRFEGRWVDWGWVSGKADEVLGLLDEAGLPPDAPVGMVPRNRPLSVTTLLALITARRSIVMIYALQSPEALAADIAKLNLAAIIADEQDWSEPALAAAAAAGSAGISLGEKGATVAAAPGLAKAGPGPHQGPLPVSGIELLTSGTTGPPKRIPMSYELIFRSMVGETTVGAGPGEPKPPPGLFYFPLGNISGLYTFLPLAAVGQAAILLEKFDFGAWWDHVRTHRPKRTGLPPAGFQMLLEAEVPKEDLACLESINSGAARLDPFVQQQFEDRYGIPLLLSYGATEFGGPVTLMTVQDRDAFGPKIGSVGRPWAGAKLRVVDPETRRPLPAGQEGLLEVMTPRMGDHWMATTDVGRIDEDGFIYHLGRADGAINRGGFKVLPETVVAALVTHPSVSDAAVVGLDDPRLGQVPVAAVELKKGAEAPSEEELKQHARRHLYAPHVPARIIVVPQLPRTPSLKISTPDVAALFTQD